MAYDGARTGRPVVDALDEACDTLATSDPTALWQLSDTLVEHGLTLVCRLRSQAVALESALLREADGRGLKAGTGAPSTQRWLEDTQRLSRAEANARHRLAAALGGHPPVADALALGELTAEQAEVVTTALDQVGALPGSEAAELAAAAEFLLEQCAVLAPRELARAGQAVVEALTRHPSIDDPLDEEAVRREHDAAERALQSREQTVLRVVRRPGGGTQLRIDLGTVGRAAFQAWCRAQADQLARGEDGFEDTRTLPERRGDAFLDLLHRGTPGARGNPDQPEEFDDVAPDESVGADGPTSDRPTRVPGEWAGVVLTVVTTLAELRAGIPGTAHLDTGEPLSVAAVRHLACDANVVPVVTNGPSQVLDLGRSCREFNRAQRRAVAVRDRGCVAPGCDQPPSACHVHHSRWWARGGPTDIDKAALLCGFHHRLVHRQDWGITLAANGFPQLHPPPHIDPSGRSRQHHRFTIPDTFATRPAGPGHATTSPTGRVLVLPLRT